MKANNHLNFTITRTKTRYQFRQIHITEPCVGKRTATLPVLLYMFPTTLLMQQNLLLEIQEQGNEIPPVSITQQR